MTFEEMLEAQRQLQIKAYGKDPAELQGDERIQFIKDMTLALTDELHEALAETNWKPWAKGNDVTEDAFQGELVDAFHFFMNLMLVGHMSAEDMAVKYASKRQKNIKRQEDGYDGKNKCPGCGRALDDDAVHCSMNESVGLVFCVKLNRYKKAMPV